MCLCSGNNPAILDIGTDRLYDSPAPARAGESQVPRCILFPLSVLSRPPSFRPQPGNRNPPGLPDLRMETRNFVAVIAAAVVIVGALSFVILRNTSSKKGSFVPSSTALARYDLRSKPRIISLPKRLDEISGLAMTADGRLFTHNDENSEVSQIDYRTGRIVKRFNVGDKSMKGDFEGIAVAGDRFFLVTSKGDLYEFAEGDDGAEVPFRLIETPLSSKQDVEGLCYDPQTDCLLLACKEDPGKGLGTVKAVYAYSLRTNRLEERPRFLVSLDRLAPITRDGRFNPSGIEYNPTSGTLFIVAAEGCAIAEISERGELLAYERLDHGIHRQAEGITFAPDNSMLISDEARGKTPTISIYPARDPDED